MGNKNKSSRPIKRKFRGNKYTKPHESRSGSSPQGAGEATKSNLDNTIQEDLDLDLCSSAKKLKLDQYDDGDFVNEGVNGFILMDMKLLFDFLSSTLRCDQCSHLGLSCGLKKDAKSGFCHEIVIRCTNCNAWETSFKTSGEGKKTGHSEVNIRMAAFVRSLGRGFSALQNFSLYLNSPPPMTKNNYRKVFREIHGAARTVALESMVNAADEIRIDVDQDDRNGVIDTAVSVDGTWQRRGHASHHGVVTANSVKSGKCIDVEVLSNICKGCQYWEGKEGSDGYERWLLKHHCKINHKGSAGAMEAIGATRIFIRSEDRRQLRYTQYLGDGDSASFKKVTESKPYGDEIEIKKLECVGHVQKRCGTRLRRLVNESKGKKLEDGKNVGGVGRLTKKKIDTLQNYFGFSIRQNAENLEQMQADVKAVLYHVASTDRYPRHEFCPSNSWCKYKLDPSSYKHRHGLPEAIVKFIEPVFEDLASPALLQKCLHGKTQNTNECLNKLIWDRCSKEYYVEKDTVEEAVYSAIAYFNDGASSVLKLFDQLGFGGHYTADNSRRKDIRRIRNATIKSAESTQKRRKTLRAIKKGFQDKAEATEGDMYTPGGH